MRIIVAVFTCIFSGGTASALMDMEFCESPKPENVPTSPVKDVPYFRVILTGSTFNGLPKFDPSEMSSSLTEGNKAYLHKTLVALSIPAPPALPTIQDPSDSDEDLFYKLFKIGFEACTTAHGRSTGIMVTVSFDVKKCVKYFRIEIHPNSSPDGSTTLINAISNDRLENFITNLNFQNKMGSSYRHDITWMEDALETRGTIRSVLAEGVFQQLYIGSKPLFLSGKDIKTFLQNAELYQSPDQRRCILEPL